MEALREHLNLLFENAPKTRKALELKEEFYVNSLERYKDLIGDGIDEEDAYQNVIQSIGDVSELFSNLEDKEEQSNYISDRLIRKQAAIKTAAIGLYIFGGIVFFAFLVITDMFYLPDGIGMIGLLIMFLIDIVPTCMLVYNANTYTKYRKNGDTIVEDFKEWNNDKKKNSSVFGAASAVLWTLTLVLYFVISITTSAWNATWIIFLIAACGQTILKLISVLKERQR